MLPEGETSTSTFQFVLSYLLAYVLPVVVFSTVVVKYSKPFVQKQLRLRRTAKLVDGDSKDGHWLYGHLKKFPFDKYEGLLNMFGMTKTQPALFSYWMGPLEMFMHMYHPDVVKTILSKSSPKGEGYQTIMSPLLGQGLIVSNGERWKRHRRLLTPIFHFNILQQHCEVFNTNCERVINWCEEVASSGRAADIADLASETSYKNMMECMMSQEVDLGKNEDYNQIVREAAQIMMLRWFNPLYHYDFIYKMTKDGKRFYAITNKIQKKVGEIIAERRALLESVESDLVETTRVDDKATGESFDFRKRKGQYVDFLDVLIQTKDQSGVGLTDRDVMDEVRTFFSAGQETVAYALSWFIYQLSKHPDFQERCRQEINEAIGSRPEIKISDMNNLPYLTQCLKESLRLMPVIHFVARQIDEDMTISHRFNDYKEIKLEKGQKVTVNIFAMHRHEEIWKNPLEYNPERFAPENMVGRPSYAFIPFSAGPRNCLGQHFAMHQMRVIIAQILRRYEIYRDEETPDPKPIPGLSLQSENGIMVKLRPV